MHIDVRIDGDKAVLALSGTLTIRDSEILREKVDALLDAGCRTLLIDLKSLSYVDSAGLGGLISAFVRAQQEGAVLRIQGMNQNVRDLFEVTQRLVNHEVKREAGLHEPFPDPLNPRLWDIRWSLTVGLGLTVLVIIGFMLLLR